MDIWSLLMLGVFVLYYVAVFYCVSRYPIWWNQIVAQIILYIVFVVTMIVTALIAATSNPGNVEIVSEGFVVYGFFAFGAIIGAPVGTIIIVFTQKRKSAQHNQKKKGVISKVPVVLVALGLAITFAIIVIKMLINV